MFLEERAGRTLREQGVDTSKLTIEIDERMVDHLRKEVQELKDSEDYLLGPKLLSKSWVTGERTRLLSESKAIEQMVISMEKKLRELMTSNVKMVLE